MVVIQPKRLTFLVLVMFIVQATFMLLLCTSETSIASGSKNFLFFFKNWRQNILGFRNVERPKQKNMAKSDFVKYQFFEKKDSKRR